MAYNNPYGPYYTPYYGQNFQPQQMQQVQQPQQPIQQPTQQPVQQIQNGGFMLVPSEEIVKTYPVAPGNCVTFKIEGKPIVMEKSMGFSQLEAPRVDRYRLVREEDIEPPKEEPPAPKHECHCNDSIEELKKQFNRDIDKIWGEIDGIKKQITRPSIPVSKKKDSGGN